MIDGIIVVVIGAALAGVIWKMIKDHKEGKSGCGCGCNGCSGCSGCASGGRLSEADRKKM